MLQRFSPWLAELLYPYLATPLAEVGVSGLQVAACGLSTVPFFYTAVPLWWIHLAALLFVPATHRLLLLDTRVLWLQLRQFETWFLLGGRARYSRQPTLDGRMERGGPAACLPALLRCELAISQPSACP